MTTPQYGPGWQPQNDGQQPGYDPYAVPQQPGQYDQQQPVQYEQPYTAPGYDPYAQPQQGYDPYGQPQQYDQYGQPMSAPPVTGVPYQQQGPYDQTYIAPPPAKKSSSKVGWIVGGIVIALVLVAGCGAGVWFLTRETVKSTTGTGGGSGGGGSTDGKYKYTSDLCQKISTTDVQSVLGTVDGTPEHRAADYGSSLYKTTSCSIKFKSEKNNSANLSIDVKLNNTPTKAKETYASQKKYDDGRSESNRTQSAVSDLGEQAYQVVTKRDYSSFKSVTYEVTIQDSNLVIGLRMNGTFNSYDEATLTTKLKALAKATMDGLK
ncbi:hypothetical protein [Longispora albida]|uniref:hypothetical protein n=1 Tax=Longispora albida TaxID=203523 RepID=UPI000373F16C|nr:hypothetical protein [Longispora albida]